MSRIVKLSSSYPDYAAASIGGPSFPAITVVNQAPAQQIPTENAQLGDILVDKFGGRFQFVRAIAALAAGQIVKPAANLTGTVTASGSTTGLVNSNITTTVDEANVGSFLTSPGTTVFTIPIKKQAAVGANTGFYVSVTQQFFGTGSALDGDVLSAIPTNGDVLHVVRPFAVDVAGAGDPPMGVALGTVTSGYRTLVQIEGIALISCDAVASHDVLADQSGVYTGAAGIGQGRLTTLTVTSVSNEAKSFVGYAKGAAASAKVIPVYLALALKL